MAVWAIAALDFVTDKLDGLMDIAEIDKQVGTILQVILGDR